MSRLLVIWPCASLVVAVFNSYLASFIVKLLTASTSLSDFSIFLLVNIASEFSLCGIDPRMNVSSVTLLASVIDPSSYHLMTFKIASRIFMLDNGNFLLSLKVFMVLLRFV